MRSFFVSISTLPPYTNNGVPIESRADFGSFPWRCFVAVIGSVTRLNLRSALLQLELTILDATWCII